MGTDKLRQCARIWHDWLRGRGRGEDPVRDADMVLALLIAGLRLGVIAQMIPSLAHGIDVSPRPALYVVCWGLAASASIATAAHACFRRRPPGARWVRADIALTVALVVTGAAIVPADDRLGTWSGFLPGYALGALLSACTVAHTRLWFGALIAVVGSLLVHLHPLAITDLRFSITSNIVTFFVLAALVRTAALWSRRMAEEAAAAREWAAQVAREDELRRARTSLHNGVALLGLLADEQQHRSAVRAGTDSAADEWRGGLRRQAREEANRMRAYLRGELKTVVEDHDGATLAQVVERGGRGFEDLPLETVADAATNLRIGPEPAAALTAALQSLLLNVRLHAEAQHVVVHVEESGAGWTITVTDDGRGFQPEPARFGVGLGEVVVASLARHGITVEVDAAPGLGTSVSMSGGGT
ncbi:ATP-binding protein [Aeromicrobium phragmitis]|nr:ATP-binding protein [Aeromicrobium phragmitis]